MPEKKRLLSFGDEYAIKPVVLIGILLLLCIYSSWIIHLSSSFSTKTSKYTLRNENVLFKTNTALGHQPQTPTAHKVRFEHRRYLKKSKR